MTGTVLIHAEKIARASETFIYAPALAMQRYTPVFVGSLRRDGLPVPEDRVFVANRGRRDRWRQALNLRLRGHTGVVDLAPRLTPLRPRLIQAHFGPSALDALPLARRLNVPFIVYYHGLDATITREASANQPYMRRYWRRLPDLQARADLVLTQSDFLRERVLAQGFDPNRVQTQYIGVAPGPEPPLSREARAPYVLFVARLTEKKGLRDLIAAMRRVQQSHAALELVIVGDGDLRDTVQRQAAESLSAYRFIGWQSPEQVTAWMREALLFSVPSVTARSGDSEGFGMVFVEAQCVGTPVVSTRHGGIVESVADGETGLLVPEHDPGALAAAIERLITDHALWQRLSRAGVERVQTRFNLHTLVSQLEDRYDALLSGS